MKVKVFISLLMAALWLSVASAGLSAFEDRRHGGMMHGEHGHHSEGMCFGNPEHMRVKLNLSEEQIKKIGIINGNYRSKLSDFRERMIPKKKELRDMLLKDDIDFLRVRELLNEISSIEVEIRILRIHQRIDIEKVLSKDQKELLRKERGR